MWHPSEDANRYLREAVRRLFIELWHSYSKIPNNIRHDMFNEIKRRYNLVISMTFERKSSGALSRWLKAARDTREPGYWLLHDVFKRFHSEYWYTPKFMKKSAQVKKARASIKRGSLHTGGAKSTGKISWETEKELQRKPTQAEVFRRIHIRKKKTVSDLDVWVYPRAQMAYVEFQW